MNKRGGFTDLFLFIIIAFVLIIASAIFIYVGTITSSKLHDTLDNKSTVNVNYTTILQQTTDEIPASYQVLKWGSAILIVAMIISIFIGSYLVTTKPIYFIPYIIIVFCAVILAVVMANSYETLLNDSTLGTILQSFTASNFMMLYLPIIVAVVGIVGGIIMYASYKVGSSSGGYYQ